MSEEAWEESPMPKEAPVWEIRVYSAGGHTENDKEDWGDAMDAADSKLEARANGQATGDEWLDSHLPKKDVQKSSTTILKASKDGGLEDIGRNDLQLIKNDELYLRGLFNGVEIVVPPTPYSWFSFMVRNSPSLAQNIEAYCRSIDGHGYQLLPVIDMTSEKSNEEIKSAIYMERLHNRRVLSYQGKEKEAQKIKLNVSDADVIERRKKIENEMAEEKARLELFFDNCNPRETLVRLRRRLRWDLESFGTGYLALKRNPWGDPLSIWWVPSRTTRAVKQSPEDLNVKIPEERFKVSTISYDKVESIRSFRRFVQGIGDNESPALPTGMNSGVLFFKEIGDPRIIGDRTGVTYASLEDLQKAIEEKKESGSAAEVIQFSLLNGTENTAYGTPRWQGQASGAMGELEAEQCNLNMLRNDAVPDMIILCEGGRFAADAVKKIEHHLKTTLKGKNRSRGILTLEAAPSGPGKGSGIVGDAPVPKIHVIPLTQYHREDALYVKYMNRQGDKIDSAFGNPPMAVGKYQMMNRATATVLADHVEKHVYQPERQDFDDLINLRLLSIFGACYWKFKSNAPVNRDGRELVELANIAVLAGILTIDESRMVVGDALSQELPPFESEFSTIPLPVYLTQLKGQQLVAAASARTLGGFPGKPGDQEPQQKSAIDTYLEQRMTGVSLSKNQVLEMLSDLRTQLLGELSSITKQAAIMGIDENVMRDALSRIERGEGSKVEVSMDVLKEWVMPLEPIKSMRTLGDLR